MPLNYLTVRGWDRYQHYKDRDPPWIKLYRDILTTESWVLGDDTSRLLQVASILLAARYSNQIPLQWTLIRKVASLDCSEKQFNSAVSHLVSTNFLEIQEVTDAPKAAEQSASTLLATCNTETEEKEEEEQSRAEKTRASALVVGLDLKAWTRFEAYRSEIRKPIKPGSVQAAQLKLAGFGADQAAVVEESIAQGWTGLFPLKRANGAGSKLTWKPPPDEPEAASA